MSILFLTNASGIEKLPSRVSVLNPPASPPDVQVFAQDCFVAGAVARDGDEGRFYD